MRRGLGRGRTLIGLGAVLVIVSIPLPWLRAGGTVLEAATTSGQGGGLPVLALFVSSVASLALMVVPFTTRSGAFRLDRPASYVVLVTVSAVGLVVRLAELLGTQGSVSLAPLDVPGTWLAIGGVALGTWGVLELIAERPTAL